MIRTRVLSTFAGILVLLVAQVASVSAGPDKVGPQIKAYLNPELNLFNPHEAQKAEGILGAASSEKGIRVLIHGDVSREALEAEGVTVTSRAGNVFSAWIPAEKILPVSDLHGMIRIQGARIFEPNNDVATADADVRTQVWGSSTPPYPGNSGVGVLIGVVDTGFDYTHDDFRTAGNISRFHAIWDQQFGSSPPPGFTGGTLWNNTSLTNLTSTTTDPQAHGTHVMGIAGGNGRGTDGQEPQYKYAGIAPDATLIGDAR